MTLKGVNCYQNQTKPVTLFAAFGGGRRVQSHKAEREGIRELSLHALTRGRGWNAKMRSASAGGGRVDSAQSSCGFLWGDAPGRRTGRRKLRARLARVTAAAPAPRT